MVYCFQGKGNIQKDIGLQACNLIGQPILHRALSAGADAEAGCPLQGGGKLVPHAAGDIQLHKECLCRSGRQGEGVDDSGFFCC